MKALLVPDVKRGQGEVKLPYDYSTYLPSFCQDWIGRYLDTHEIARHRIGWSDTKKSMVLPVFIEGSLVMYQTRYFGDNPKEPKYKTVGYKNDVIFIPKEHDEDIVILVEDYVSAIKIGRITNSVPIFGSNVNESVIYRLSKMFKRAKIWLDADMKKRSIETALMMNGMGLPTTTIFSGHDPKEYITPDLRMIINLGDKE